MVTYWRRNARSDSVESGEPDRVGLGDDEDEDDEELSDRMLGDSAPEWSRPPPEMESERRVTWLWSAF